MPRSTTLDLIKKLISFDTTSRESNLELIAFIQGYLSDLGVESLLVHNEEGTKANLYATIGDQDKAGVMLSGHTDVVPVDGQNWSSDPFEIREDGGKLYGRGTSDMKGFIAICLAMVPEFQAQPLSMPIHLAFSYDEEIGCMGVRRLLDKLNAMPVRPAMCVVGEPTDMQVITGHKGKRSYMATIRGLEAHSSLIAEGVNAVEFAAELVSYLRKLSIEFRTDGPFDELFDVPYTTVHTGVMEGGTALNIVPKEASVNFEFRHIGIDDPDAIEAKIRSYVTDVLEPMMHEVDPNTGIDIDCYGELPGLDLHADDEVVTFFKALAGRNDHAKVAFGTEAGLFQKMANIPSVVCGPGSIVQAHKPDEWITLEQIDKCEKFMERLIEKLTT